MTYAGILLVCFISHNSVAEQIGDSGHLLDLVEHVPQLAWERIEVSVESSPKLERLSAITADKQGNLYVLHRPETGDPVVVLDHRGKLLRSWGQGMFRTPHGIRLDRAGNVWTVDSGYSKVHKFSPIGELLLEIDVGDNPDPSSPFCGATDLAFGKQDHFFVADGYCNGRVVEFDGGGRKVREWGTRGTGLGEFNVVHSIAVSPQGNNT